MKVVFENTAEKRIFETPSQFIPIQLHINKRELFTDLMLWCGCNGLTQQQFDELKALIVKHDIQRVYG